MFFTAAGYNKSHDVLDSISKAKNIKIYLCVSSHWILYLRSMPDSVKWEDLMSKKGYFSPGAKEKEFKDSVEQASIKLVNWQLATTTKFIQNNNVSEGLVLNLTAFTMAYLSSKDTSKFAGENYAKISISASSNLPANIKNKYSDLAGDLPFELTENQIDNDRKLIAWLRDLDNIMSGSNAEIASGAGDNNIYFLEGRDTTRIQDKSSIYRTRQDNRKIVLRVRKIIGNFDRTNTSWEVEGQKVSLNADTCVVVLDKKGSLKVEVFENNKKVAKLTAVVYTKPTVVFKEGKDYKGEYGFDDVHSKAYAPMGLKADYQRNMLEGIEYYTSLVSVLPNQKIKLKIEYDLVGNAKKDKNFRLKFFGSNIAIKLGANEVDTLYKTYDEINKDKNKELDIVVKNALTHNNYTRPDTIKVYDHLNALVGQIHIFCDNILTKNLVFVYVNNGRGYPNVKHQDYVNHLNNNSFNQIHIGWNVTKDSLNLSASSVTQSDVAEVANALWDKYKTLKILSDTSAYYIFVTKISALSDNDVAARGIGLVKLRSAFLFNTSSQYVGAHELGHVLGLRHAFADAPNSDIVDNLRKIGLRTSSNHMDYGDPRKMFFKYQYWRIKK